MAVRKLKHIKQTNGATGCGPACLAMVARKSEMRAIVAIFGEKRTKKLRTKWPQLRKGLSALGVAFQGPPRRVAAWDRIPGTAIVGCGKRKDADGDDIWHWVVYQREGQGLGLVYDPAHDAPYVPTGRNRKPFSFLPVTPSP